jgi:hypothetical protein
MWSGRKDKYTQSNEKHLFINLEIFSAYYKEIILPTEDETFQSQ